MKFVVFSLQHKAFEQIMIDGRKKLWHGNYSEYGKTVIKQCEKQSMIFVALFIVSTQFSAFTYALEPILGKYFYEFFFSLRPFGADVMERVLN